MPRDKEVTLFSKNHISIKKIIYINNKKLAAIKEATVSISKVDNLPSYRTDEWVDKKFESPLGFWYMKRVKKDKPEYDWSREIKEIVIHLREEKYIISYIISSNETKIGKDMRPWDIVKEDEAMSDHFISDLFKIMSDLFDKCNEEGLSKIKNYISTLNFYEINLDKFKNMIFEDLFGNTKGPRYQTDIEKIISHGFDTKTSFRKV